jgi:hypothetical protein
MSSSMTDATPSVLRKVRRLTPIECPAVIAEETLTRIERARATT